MKAKYAKLAAGVTSGIAILSLGVSTTFADTNGQPGPIASQMNFNTKYQANLAEETTLYTQANAGTHTANVQALLNAASTINAQVGTLYTTEQALVASYTTLSQTTLPIPPTPASTPTKSSQWTQWTNQRDELLKQWKHQWADFMKEKKGHGKGETLKALFDAQQNTQVKLGDLDDHMHGRPQPHPRRQELSGYTRSIAKLEHSILNLQDAALYYTKLAIELESVPSTTPPMPPVPPTPIAPPTTGSTTNTSTTTSTSGNVTVTQTN